MNPECCKLKPAEIDDSMNACLARMFPDYRPAISPAVFADVQQMFEGRWPDYQACDTPYHNFRHTLQVLLCYKDIMEGWRLSGSEPRVTPRQCELAAVAILFHDIGYLKLRADTQGTGAKYTSTHVLRSCSFASSYLPRRGITLDELESILAMIRCTDLAQGSHLDHSQKPIDSILGCAVATADYLAQMAAPDYPETLPLLFAEFQESDNHTGVPPAQRHFNTLDDLIAGTPAFWRDYVFPHLKHEFRGIYRLLARPSPDGPNAYIEAVESNIARIEKQKNEEPYIYN